MTAIPNPKGEKTVFTLLKTGFALAALVLAIAPAAHAQSSFPFRATFTGLFSIVGNCNGDPTLLDLRVSGTSTDAPFGLLQNIEQACIDTATAPPRIAGSGMFVAANGDQLFTELSGTFDGSVGMGPERFVGGTGIFVGASGVAQVTTTTMFTSPTTGTFVDVFNGTITLPAATIPEPSSALGLLTLGTLGAGSSLKRRNKPSKSLEKEIPRYRSLRP